MGEVTLKNLPKLKTLVSRYAKKEADWEEAPMNAGRVVLEGLPALETVQLNGTSLLNAEEIVFQNLPKLQTVMMAGSSACNYTTVTFNGECAWGV